MTKCPKCQKRAEQTTGADVPVMEIKGALGSVKLGRVGQYYCVQLLQCPVCHEVGLTVDKLPDEPQ